MANLWIVHRDPRWREALRRMAGSVALVDGAPSEWTRFDDAAPPRAVLLGVGGDFEAELEFAHRHAARLGATPWVLLARERDRGEVERLFDALPCSVVSLTGDADLLRARLVAALARRGAASLSARNRRDALAERFALYTADLDLPALLAASSPALAELPILIRGERGVGRGLVARYLAQTTRESAREGFVAIPGAGFHPVAALDHVAGALRFLDAGARLAICVEDADQIEAADQRLLRDWIENGLPLARARVRWMATAGDDPLDPALARALAGHEIALPPLRERPAAVEAWLAATGRRFTDDARAHLLAHPWPGNFAELDALLRRTLAARPSGDLSANDLHFAPGIFDDEDLLHPYESLAPPRAPVPPAPRHQTRTEEPASEAATGGFARSEPQASEVEKAGTHEQPDRLSRLDVGSADPPTDPASLHSLSRAIAHEVGNPLVGIRTYAALLPSRFDDAEFRAQFAERVDADVRRIENVIETLAQLGHYETPRRDRVDVSALLASILEGERPRIRERRLVVLEELDRVHPAAIGDAEQLRFAFTTLLEAALAWIPARGDLYVATRRRRDARGAWLRVELRMRGAGDGLGFGEHALAVAVVEAVARGHGGSLTSEPVEEGETALTVDLPAPDADA